MTLLLDMIAKFNQPIGRMYSLTNFNASPILKARKYTSFWMRQVESLL